MISPGAGSVTAIRYFALVIGSVMALTGCGGDDPTGPKANGTFTASYIGTISGTTSGTVGFGAPVPAIIRMTGTGAIKEILIVNGGAGGRIVTGEHNIDNAARTDAFAFLSLNDAGTTSFEATGGTVTITTSAPDAVIGTFEIWYATPDGLQTISVSGSFEATCVVSSQTTCP